MTMHASDQTRSTRRTFLVVLLGLLAIIGILWANGTLRPRPKVAIVTANEGPYWDLIIRGAQDAAERHKVQLTVVKSKGDEASQTDAIRGLLGKGFGGIAISPNDPSRQAAILADVATEADLVTFDSDSNVSRRLCFIGTDNYDAGRMCGQQIRQAIPDGGEVILSIGSLDKENGQRRRQGVIDELTERSFERNRPMDPVEGAIKGPKYTVVATLVDGIDSTKATAMATDAIAKYPNAKCIAGLFAFNTPAILKALEPAGKLGKIQVVGFDANEETLKGIESGNVFATIIQDPYSIGFESVRVLADSARGDRGALPLFSQVYLACDSVNKANVDATRQDIARKQKPGSLTAPHADVQPAPAAAEPTTKAGA